MLGTQCRSPPNVVVTHKAGACETKRMLPNHTTRNGLLLEPASVVEAGCPPLATLEQHATQKFAQSSECACCRQSEATRRMTRRRCKGAFCMLHRLHNSLLLAAQRCRLQVALNTSAAWLHDRGNTSCMISIKAMKLTEESRRSTSKR